MTDAIRHRIQLDTPAGSFLDAFLLGDGRLGAAVHGQAGAERFDLNLDTFWSGGPLPSRDVTSDSQSRWLEPVREAVRARDHATAQALAARLQGQTWSQSYQPLGGLVLHTSCNASFLDRELDMATATATSRAESPQGTSVVRSWISAVRHALVIDIAHPAGDLALEFDSPHDPERVVIESEGVNVVTWAGRAPAVAMPDYLGDLDRPVRWATGDPDEDGLVDVGQGFAVAALTQRLDQERIRVIVTAVDGFRGRTARPSADLPAMRMQAATRALQVGRVSTEDLRDEHEAEHRSWFDRVDLDLSASGPSTIPEHADAASAELFFDLGRYLLIASSRPGSQAANLQGIWNDDIRPGWSCNWTTNINLPMNYWPAARLGLGELTEPFASLVQDLAELSTTTAQTVYGAPGWALHHNADIWGFSAPVRGTAPTDPHHANWPVAGLWLTSQLRELERYGVELDVDLWEIAAGAAEFALHLLEPDADGLLQTNPSTTPEHDFVVDGVEFSVSAGTAMDQQLVSEAFDVVLDLHRLGRAPQHAEELIARVAAARGILRPPRIGHDGALQEWAEDWEPADRGHRHLSHLYGLFPGRMFDAETTPLLETASRRALQDRLAHGSGYTGWSQGWILCLAARIHDADLVQRSIDILVRDLTSSSLLDLHPVPNHWTGYRFQIDGNFGGVAGMAESLASARDGAVSLLPALPISWPAGQVRGLVVEGGHRIDITWENGRVSSASITAGSEGHLQVTGPGLAPHRTHVMAGDVVNIRA
ncbi:hypothetical protein DZF95_00115 [Clavibacter michiganensis]|nr:hypothetical protein DZF95_00115 [Clavibacter michiganensis]